MPAALPRACVGTCPNDGRTCPQHSRSAQLKAYDRRRGTAHQRGYTTSRWVPFTRWYRDEQIRLGVSRAGLCGSRLPGAPETADSVCAQHGLTTYGRVLDHIRPVTGPDDPQFYDITNLQLLCDGAGMGLGCHDRKRQRERRS